MERETIYTLIVETADERIRLYSAHRQESLLTFSYLLYVLKDNAVDNPGLTVDEIRAALETDGVCFKYDGGNSYRMRLVKVKLAD